MSNAQDDSRESVDSTETRKGEKNGDLEKDKGNKSKNVGAATKGKDLSHVPCKFFKVGQCTAGSACVFSHHVAEPGETKEICSWFVKGNCKFGHKCALAHILPGQPMSMDRKNKKAAQQQNANGAGKNDRDKEWRKDGGRTPNSSSGAKVIKDRPLASVLTSRLVGPGASARAPMAISKATMSPSAPAPALRDADFTSSSMETTDGNSPPVSDIQKGGVTSPATTASAWRQDTAQPTFASAVLSGQDVKPIETLSDMPVKEGEIRKPSPLPLSTPSGPRGFTFPNGSPAVDFGPVGSPPHSSPMSSGVHLSSPGQLNQARINGFSPGTSPTHATPLPSASPFSAPGAQTLFSNYTLERDTVSVNDFSSRSGIAASLGPNTTLGSRAWDIQAMHHKLPPGAEGEEDDIEDFLPSSLNELLTPAERRRRESRSSGVRPSLEAHHHRHSRSVPALSLMDHMKNIWSDDHIGPTNPSSRAFSPSSFTGNDTYGSNPLSTSNISTGFMTGLHFSRPGVTQRSVSDTHTLPPPLSGSPSKGSSLQRSPFDQVSYGFHPPPPPPSTQEDMLSAGLNSFALSPSARALQQHAPGTSLPQGLAAGYSRIHARPPSIFSALSPPSTAGIEDGIPRTTFTPSTSRMVSSNSMSSNGLGASPVSSPTPGSMQPVTVGSVATRRTRNGAHPLSSPLAGPVITNDLDEEEVFEMDVENQN